MARMLVKFKTENAEAAEATEQAPSENMDAMLDRYEADQAAVEGRNAEDQR
jgi:hypothetical protein